MVDGMLGPAWKAKATSADAEGVVPSGQQAPLLIKTFQGLAQATPGGYRAAQRHLGVGPACEG